MSDTKKIGAKIVLDGEKEFNQSIRNSKTALKELDSELKLTSAQFKDQEKSLEALQKVQQTYAKRQQELQKTEKTYVDQLEKASKAHEDALTIHEKTAKKVEDLRKELEQAKNTYGENSDEVKKLNTELEKSEKEYEKEGNAIGNLENQMSRWKTDLNNTRTELAETDKKLEEVSHSIDNFGESIDEVDEATKNTTPEINNFGLSLSNLVTADLVADVIRKIASSFVELAKEVVQTGSEFEKAMSNVGALSGATGQALDELSEKAQQLGASTMFSASQAADAFSYMALAGWDTKQMLDGIEPVLNLAAAADMDLAQASDIVTDYLTAFGLEAKDASKFTDQLAFAMANSNTDVEMLGEAYKNCAAAAGSMNYSVEDVTGALMTMANAGVKGGEAGTSLRAIMINLATDTNGCASALEEFGVHVYDDLTGQMRPLSNILLETAAAFEGFNDEQSNAMAKLIAGKTQYTGFQTIMLGLSEAAKENGQSMLDYAAALSSCDGYAKQMADTMQDNLQGDITILESAMDGLKIATYECFDKGMRTSVQTASDAFSVLTASVKNGELGASLKDLGNAFADLSEEVALMAESSLPDFINALTWLLENGEAIGDGLNAGFNPIGNTINEIKDLGDYIDELVSGHGKLSEVAERTATVYQSTAESFDMARFAIGNLSKEERLEQEIALGQERLVELADERTDAEKRLAEAKEHLAELEEQQDMGKTVQGYEDAKNAVDIYQQSLNDINDSYGVLQGQLLGYEAQQDSANQKMQEATGIIGENKEALIQWSEDGQQAYADAYEAAEKSLAGQSGLFTDLDIKTETTMSQMSSNLQEQTQVFDQFANDLQRASQLANNMSDPEFKEIVANIESMGVDGAGYLHELVKAAEENGEEFNQLLDDWASMTEARSQLKETMATFEADYTDGIDTLSKKQLTFHEDFKKNDEELTKDIKENVTTTTEEITDTVNEGLEGINSAITDAKPIVEQNASDLANAVLEPIESTLSYDELNEIGSLAGQGLENGLRSQIDAVRIAAQELANAANQGVSGPKGLDEHSPSKKMHEYGRLGGIGLAEGFEETLPDVIGAVNSAMPNDNNIEVNSFQNMSINSNDTGNEILTKIDNMLSQYLPDLAEKQVVLDTGKTVGALAPGINQELGRINSRRV